MTICIYALSKSMLVHKQLTVLNLFCSVFPVITYIFKGNCVVVMHVQLQLCIIATCNSWFILYYHHSHFDLCEHACKYTPCYFLL